jgi:hypothetical protein
VSTDSANTPKAAKHGPSPDTLPPHEIDRLESLSFLSWHKDGCSIVPREESSNDKGVLRMIMVRLRPNKDIKEDDKPKPIRQVLAT